MSWKQEWMFLFKFLLLLVVVGCVGVGVGFLFLNFCCVVCRCDFLFESNKVNKFCSDYFLFFLFFLL